jgi:tetratricopeptide (TPR) repeat protein
MSAAHGKPVPASAVAPKGIQYFGKRRGIFLAALLLAALVFATFYNGIKGPYIFDDVDSVLNNASIRSFSTALTPPNQNGITVGGRPTLNLSFAINYAFCQTETAGYHVGNILIHALAAITLFLLVRCTILLPTFEGRFTRVATPLAWLVAALWAVHPLQTESVTYIAQRAESLAGLLYLLTLYCFVRYTTTRDGLWFAASVSSCLLGMGAKEVMATAPFVMFLYDRTFVSGTFRNAWKRYHWIHVSHAATLLLLGALVYASEARGGSVGTDEFVAHWSYLCTQAYAVVRYTGLSLWPVGLTFDYGPLVVSAPLTIVFCGAVVIAAIGCTAWALVRKPLLGFLGAWFFIVLAPSSSFIPVNTQTMAEHRMYLPLVAIIIGVAFAVFKLLGQRSWILLSLLLLPVATATVARNQTYLSEITLWADNVNKAPANHRGWLSLSSYHLYLLNDPAAAAKEAQVALNIRPNNPDGLNCLGVSLIKLGRRDEGLALVEQSLLGHQTSLTLSAGAGAAYQECGQYEQAVMHYSNVLALQSSNSAIHYNVAVCLMQLARYKEAEPHFRQALADNQAGVHILCGLGSLLQRLGRTDEAIVYFSRAVGVAPQSSAAHGGLGAAYMSQGNSVDGLRELREAVRLDPKSYQQRASLCRALAYTHRNDEAIPLCETLLKEKPDAELFNNLGKLYGETGQLEKAAAAFQAALQIDPDNPTALKNFSKAQAYLEAQPPR